MRKVMVVLAVLAAAALACGQPAAADDDVTLKDVLSGNVYPLSLALKDLDSSWRRVNAGGQSDMGGLTQMFTSLVSAMGGTAGFYTKGETVKLSGETYIIAYRPKAKPLEFSMSGRGQPPKPEKLTPDTPLLLSLLSLRTAGSLTDIDIRLFDMEEEIAASAAGLEEQEKTAQKAASLNNLKQMALALRRYAHDYDGTLPPMEDPGQVKTLLEPYVKDTAVFCDPRTGQPYLVNTSLSNHKLAHISNPVEMVVFYEASPDEDNSRRVSFLDGHAERILESEWPLVKKRSKIP